MLHQPVKFLPQGTLVVLRDSCCYLPEDFRVLLPQHAADGEAGPAAGWLLRAPVWVAARFGSTGSSALEHSDLMWRKPAGDR